MPGMPFLPGHIYRHLFKAKEMLGMRLCVLHNLYFYNKMMEEIRDCGSNSTGTLSTRLRSLPVWRKAHRNSYSHFGVLNKNE